MHNTMGRTYLTYCPTSYFVICLALYTHTVWICIRKSFAAFIWFKTVHHMMVYSETYFEISSFLCLLMLSEDNDIKRKPSCIGGMELVSLSCNRVFISAESVGRCWCKIPIATKWYKFHVTDKCGFFMPWITDQYTFVRYTKLVNKNRHRCGESHYVFNYDNLV